MRGLALLFTIVSSELAGAAPGPSAQEAFELFGGAWREVEGEVTRNEELARSGGRCIHLWGSVEFVPVEIVNGSRLEFWAERWTRRAPFTFRVEAHAGDGWVEIYQGDDRIRVGRGFLSRVVVPLPRGTSRLRFTATAPEGTGVLIDDLSIVRSQPMEIVAITGVPQTNPLLIGKEDNPVLRVVVETEGDLAPRYLTAIEFEHGRHRLVGLRLLDGEGTEIAGSSDGGFRLRHQLVGGTNEFYLAGGVDPGTPLGAVITVRCTGLSIDGREQSIPESLMVSNRVGIAVRQSGEDNCHTYRIPGIATTNDGTLIAVYDNRYRGGGDLPGDIDVGMSRSTDGGQSWGPMRVIMDMGDDPEWHYDGIGDPAILVDESAGTIWVAATWSHGDRSWNGSGPGLSPEETGQLMLAKSEDDGLTWSDPINITSQVKDPRWRFVLQGPGNGITMNDGTLVFPAQYRSENAPPNLGKPFSTILYSRDHGETWKIGSGVKIDTTEAQVVQLGDGSLMINCRDNRGGSRSIYTTADLGATWQVHPSSRSALPEPICNADLLRIVHRQHGPLLIFSNPNTTRGRHHYTLKVSNDEGLTWPEKWHTLYDTRSGAGYSTLTQVDGEHIGVLYEGPGGLYFLKYAIGELLR